MRQLSIDIETYSPASLPDCGVAKYAEHPEFEILLFAYSEDMGPVKVIDLACGEALPPRIVEALFDPKVLKTAYTAAFERTCLSQWFGRYCRPEEWECDMVLAASCGLPLSLKQCGEALGLSEDKAKMKEGADLIKLFCMPRKPTKKNPATRVYPEDEPEKWEVFKQYNKRDVEAENVIRRKLLKWKPDAREHSFWALDQRINDKGIRVDTQLAANAIRIGEAYKNRLLDKAVEISGLANPNSTAQIKDWLKEQEGMEVLSLNKKAVADVVSMLNDDKTKEFMALRAEFSKSSTKKYDAILRCVADDGHVHGCFQFNGAGRTGRFAGRQVQLQNLPQNHMPDLDDARALVVEGDDEGFEALYPEVQQVLSELIRTSLIPEDGQKFIVADFSAIEARVLAWVAGEKWRLDTFREGGDIYCASASQMFHVPVVKHGENGHLRQKGKVAELALGYGGGVNALKVMGGDKLGMTDEEMAETVEKWRAASPHVVRLWKDIEQAAIKAVVRKTSAVSTIGKVQFDFEDGVLFMRLPSGRRVAYWGAEYTENRIGKKTLSYMGQDQKTKKWSRLETWGGKLTENLIQAISRDVLREAMLRLSEAGYDIRAHVHDEIIATCPADSSVAEMAELMGAPVDWAQGLPLRADGYDCSSYRKD